MDLKMHLDLSDINYKFMDLKIHFQSFRVYGPVFSKFMNLSDTNYKMMDLKCIFGVHEPKHTSLQVGGPLVHFALSNIYRITRI
jgi:hypothetical protein